MIRQYTPMAPTLVRAPFQKGWTVEEDGWRRTISVAPVTHAEDEVNDTDARLWHPWLRINRVLRVMLHTRWSAEAWSVVRVEFKKALALRSEIRRAGWFN